MSANTNKARGCIAQVPHACQCRQHPWSSAQHRPSSCMLHVACRMLHGIAPVVISLTDTVCAATSSCPTINTTGAPLCDAIRSCVPTAHKRPHTAHVVGAGVGVRSPNELVKVSAPLLLHLYVAKHRQQLQRTFCVHLTLNALCVPSKRCESYAKVRLVCVHVWALKKQGPAVQNGMARMRTHTCFFSVRSCSCRTAKPRCL